MILGVSVRLLIRERSVFESVDGVTGIALANWRASSNPLMGPELNKMVEERVVHSLSVSLCVSA